MLCTQSAQELATNWLWSLSLTSHRSQQLHNASFPKQDPRNAKTRAKGLFLSDMHMHTSLSCYSGRAVVDAPSLGRTPHPLVAYFTSLYMLVYSVL